VINEIAIAVALTLAGSGFLTAVRRDVAAAARCWLSVPIGAVIYLIVGLVSLLFVGTLDPGPALLATLAVGVVAAAISMYRGGLTRTDFGWILVGVGLAVVTVLAARYWHLTRLTPDSLRYLLASNDLVLPDGLAEMNATDLITRQMGLPALHSLSDLVGRDYLASLGPLFGVFGFGLFAWLGLDVTGRMPRRRDRLALVGTAAVFLAASNRLVYDSFYINTHIQMASLLLIAVAGAWMAISGRAGWSVPAGLALAATLVLRPEAPLVVAIILVTVAASRAGQKVRLTMAIPSVVVVALWYGLGLWPHAAGGNEVSPTAPVFAGTAAVVLAAILCIAGGSKWARPWARWLDVAGLAGLALLLVVYVAADSAVFMTSLESTVWNLGRDGFWLLTWVAVVPLLVVALFIETVPNGRMWTVPILGFALLYWALPYLREGAWRVGAGDSGNRILAHYLAVTVVFLVLAAVHNRGTNRDRPAGSV
jgi:hypothetical protein